MKPIIFKSEMIKAILEGRKTQTRRVIIPQPKWSGRGKQNFTEWKFPKIPSVMFGNRQDLLPFCPYGQVGDRLWVRETWRLLHINANHEMAQFYTIQWKDSKPMDYSRSLQPFIAEIIYYNRKREIWKIGKIGDRFGRWRPSIHMPRWASRITLEITNIRVERLQEINHEDAEAEGIYKPDDYWHETGKTTIDEFANLWDFLNAKRGYGWDTNLYVYVIEFRKLNV